MNISDALAQIDLTELTDEEAVPVATALLSLHIAEHPELWLQLAGDRSVVGYETIMQFILQVPIEGARNVGSTS